MKMFIRSIIISTLMVVTSVRFTKDKVPKDYLFKTLPKFIASSLVGLSTFQNFNTFDVSSSIKNNQQFILNIPAVYNNVPRVNAVETINENKKIFDEVWNIVNENYYDSTFNNHNWNDIKTEYNNKIKNKNADDHQLTMNALNLLGDKYTRLLDKEKYQSLWKYDAIGVGLLLQSNPDKSALTVPSDPLQGSTSYQAGIRKDDIILSINNAPTKGKSALDILDMMSNDNNENVIIEYKHPFATTSTTTTATTTTTDNNNNNNIQKVSLKRSQEKVINPVTYYTEKVSSGDVVGYIKLTEFNSEAVHGLEKALQNFNNYNTLSSQSPSIDPINNNNNNEDNIGKGVNAIVLDLRGNLGGGFQFALNIGGK